MADACGVRQQEIPLSELEHGLFGRFGDERRRLCHGQPPILSIASWAAANIAAVGLGKRHTRISPQAMLDEHQPVPVTHPSEGEGSPCIDFLRKVDVVALVLLCGRIDFVTSGKGLRRYWRADLRIVPADSLAFSTRRILPAGAGRDKSHSGVAS